MICEADKATKKEFRKKEKERHVRISLTVCLIILCLTGLEVIGADTKILVDHGRPAATIVISRNAIDAVVDTALELRQYIKKTTGADLPLAHDELEIEGTKILAGESAYTKDPGLKNRDFNGHEYLIKTLGNCLVLMGSDGSLEEIQRTPGKPGVMAKRYFQKIGNIYAVNTFLEKCCGVRWYLPGETGEVFPENDTISAGKIQISRRPWMRMRALGRWDNIPATLWTWKDMKYSGDLAPSRRLRWARKLKGGSPLCFLREMFKGAFLN